MKLAPTRSPEAPFCVDGESDTWLRPRVTAARDFLLNQLDGVQVEGLILTGSVARGEASVLLKNGRRRLLGDVEFLLIVSQQPRWGKFRRQLRELGRRATESLSEGEDEFPVEYTPAGVSYLRARARPSTFTWDLRQHGRIVAGRPDLLQEIPEFRRTEIPREDAMETLMNRGLELLAVDESSGGIEAVTYALVKAVLDAAGSVLAFDGSHESLASRRAVALRDLMRRRPELSDAVVDADRFVALVQRSAQIKIRPVWEELSDFGKEVDAGSVRAWICDLWRWEAGQLLSRAGADTSSLLADYRASEALPSRLRGWVKYAWHPLRPPKARVLAALVSWLMEASPRRLVYSAAVLALEGGETWEERAARLLPSRTDGADSTVHQIIENWKWLIRNN